MIRRFVFCAAALAAWHPCLLPAQTAVSQIIPEGLAAQHGMTRAWTAQVQMDSGRSRLQDLVLSGGILYAQSDRGMVQAIDAETGATLWAKQIGRPEHPSMTPGVGRELLAVVNGSRLFVANRFTGKILLEREIQGAPGAGPAVSDQRVYVPTISGQLLSYHVDQLRDKVKKAEETAADVAVEQPGTVEKQNRPELRLSQVNSTPLIYQSKGRALTQPLVTRESAAEEYFAWPTDQGFMYIAHINRDAPFQIEVKYRLQTAAPITAQPTYLPPNPAVTGDSGIILAASGDGYVHAILEKTGEPLWRFSTGEALSQPAVVVDERVYAATPSSGLYCLDVKSADVVWRTPGIVQFISAGKNRVYGVDKMGQIRVLDAATGRQLDTLPVASLTIKLLNDDSDRIYLATSKGLIQCLHETGLTTPVGHDEARKKAAEEAAKSGTVQKSAEKPAEEKPAPKEAAEKKPAEEAEKTDAAAETEEGATQRAPTKAGKPDAAKDAGKDPFAE
jgi:outer membrane protein assembly factor BamB